jgi:hypothetical protein
VEVQVLPDGELAVQGVLLRDDPAELLGQRRVGGDVHPAQERAARRRHHPGGEHTRGGGLARAVRAEQAEDLPGFDVQVEPVDRGEVGARVDLGEVLGVDDGVRLAGLRCALRRGFCCPRLPASLQAPPDSCS